MNKKELAEAYAEKSIDFLTEMIEKGLIADGEVMIRGFGKFHAASYQEREGVNPRTGERVVIPKREAVRFVASRNLKNRVLTARSNEK